jgi:hypothetical protein
VGEFRPPHRSDYARDGGEKWDECCLCGIRQYRAIVPFDTGVHEPSADTWTNPGGVKTFTDGETLTGATTGHTGILETLYLTSGSWAGGDAAGTMLLRSPTGYDSVLLQIFQNNELIKSGATTIATVNVPSNTINPNTNLPYANPTVTYGSVTVSGRMVSDGDLIEYQGKKYCKEHYGFKFRHDWEDEIKIDRKEGDRE